MQIRVIIFAINRGHAFTTRINISDIQEMPTRQFDDVDDRDIGGRSKPSSRVIARTLVV